MSSKPLNEPGAPLLSGGAERFPSIRRRLVWFAEAATLAAFWQVCALLPTDRACALGREILQRYGPRSARNKNLRRNFKRAFPGKTQEEISRLTRRSWGTFGQVLAEFPHLDTICWREADERMEVVVKEPEAGQCGKKPAIFVTAHLAQWEISAASAVAAGIPLAVVYSPLENPLINRMLLKKRTALRCELVDKNASPRELMRHVAKGRSIGLVVDQRVDSGELLPFFGRPSYTSVTAARLALKFGLDLVPVQVTRGDGSRFKIVYHKAIKPRDTALDARAQSLDMTAQLNETFESWIRKRPGQWYCAKRRWKWDAQFDPPQRAK